MKLVIWNGKKDLHSLIFILLVLAFLFFPDSEESPKRVTTFIHTVFQGDRIILNGHEIYTGNDYVYSHHQYLGGVTVNKVLSGYRGIDWSYNLSFDEGSERRIGDIATMCSHLKNNCETIRFDRFIGVNVATYIEARNSILNWTIYYNSNCDVYPSHRGNPFDQRYLNMVKRFFNDNCQPTNS